MNEKFVVNAIDEEQMILEIEKYYKNLIFFFFSFIFKFHIQELKPTDTAGKKKRKN